MSDTQIVDEVSATEDLSQDTFGALFSDKPLVITDSEVRD